VISQFAVNKVAVCETEEEEINITIFNLNFNKNNSNFHQIIKAFLHEAKIIQFRGCTTPIVLQNDDGP
jgi:hypothetical protein